MSVVHIFRFCARQGWTLPQLLLILPPERDTSEQSIMKLSGREHITFVSTTQLSANSVLSWLHGRILSRVEPIQDIKQLEEVWLNTTHIQEKKVPQYIRLCFHGYRVFIIIVSKLSNVDHQHYSIFSVLSYPIQ